MRGHPRRRLEPRLGFGPAVSAGPRPARAHRPDAEPLDRARSFKSCRGYHRYTADLIVRWLDTREAGSRGQVGQGRRGAALRVSAHPEVSIWEGDILEVA